MIFLIPLFFVLTEAQALKGRSLMDLTFTRDNTYCQVNGKRIEIQIRSKDRFHEPKESGYGEHVVWYPKGKNPYSLPLNKDGINSYKLFHGKSRICSKSYAYQMTNNKLAVLFLVENRPFKNKLAIQFFDTKSLKALNHIVTDYSSDETEPYSDGFLFKTYVERNDIDMGKVSIGGIDYTFQDRHFPLWMSYTSYGFEVMNLSTFQKFPFKEHFKDENDFFSAAGWDLVNKNFNKTLLYLAVNHKLKKQCVLLMSQKVKLDGSEPWRCRDQN